MKKRRCKSCKGTGLKPGNKWDSFTLKMMGYKDTGQGIEKCKKCQGRGSI